MKPEQFIREFGEKKAREILSQYEKFIHVEKPTHFDTDLEIFIHEADFKTGKLDESDINLSDLKRLVESLDLVNNCGGLAIANKITFQKRLRNEKATHFIQHPENQKLIQLLGRNQRKPKEAIKFDLFEQAIRDYESIYGGGDES